MSAISRESLAELTRQFYPNKLRNIFEEKKNSLTKKYYEIAIK